jgi:hypothetical protein
MSEMSADRPLLADLREDLAAFGDELRELAAARWELARLELAVDWRAAKRLAVGWLTAAVTALVALPLLVVALADSLAGGKIGSDGWLMIFAGGLLLLAAASGYFAWRRFRRLFVGFSETLEELREDLAWLREMAAERTT